MGAGLSMSVTRKTDLAKRLNGVPKALQSGLYKTMLRAVAVTESDLKRNSFTGQKGSDPFWGVTGAKGNALGARTGHTRNSITSSVLALPPLRVVGTVGSPQPNVKIHEEGGTISGHPYLVIPTAVLQRDHSGTIGPSTAMANTFIWKSPRGNLWIAEKGTDRSKLAAELNGYPLLLALLKTSVTMRPRRMFATCLRRMRAQVVGMLGATFVGTVRAA